MRRTAWLRLFWGTVCFLFALVAFGQTTNYIVDQFDSDTTDSYVNQNWGTAVPTITWDNTQNETTSLGPKNPGSGSAKWMVPWTTTGDQIEVTRVFNGGAVLNLNNYTSVSFDIMFASNSATDGTGSYGAVEVDCIPQSLGWPSNSLATYTSSVANGNSWIHVTLPVSATGHPELGAVTGIGFKIQQGRTGSNLSGTTTFWIDNIVFSGFAAPPVTGPPQIIQLNSPQLWQRLEFQITNVPVASNPFDPNVIRLDATFTLPSGKTMAVPAFWYQGYQRSLSGNTEYDTVSGAPQWRLRFTPPEAGNYSLSLTVQTNKQPYATVVTNFTVASNPLPDRFGYVGIATNHQYFETGDGRALPLIGEDVAWPSSRGTYDYDTYFTAMHNAGENFARVWMAPWSLGIEDAPGTLNNYAQAPAWQLDYILQLAEAKGIYLQLTLDYHGMFNTQPDYWGGNNYWPQNPYNVTNGGPCLIPDAFFTNGTAITIYEKRLRYLIGRYGYSQNLLAWEFFNEIDNDYPSLNPTNVTLWHRIVGTWLHANDPYHHLITTSLTYAKSHPEIWNLPQIDYSSEHAYTMSASPLSIASDSQYFLQTFGKPIMIGEFGTDWRGWNYNNSDPYLRGYREGIWSGVLGGSVGTSMSWWWDPLPDYSVYSALTTILGDTGWGHGNWSKILFKTGPSINPIGLRNSNEALVYLVTADANFPTGATNASLPVQQGQIVALTNWPGGTYYAKWYDPASGSLVGNSQASTTNGGLSLALPDFTVDLMGIIYAQPSLTAPKVSPDGAFQFQLNSGIGGVYSIEKSTNLLDWIPFTTVTNHQAVSVVSDPEPPAATATFYRAQQN